MQVTPAGPAILSYIPRELAVKGISFHRYKLEDLFNLLLNTLAT
jgi:hypothetical protein